MTDPSDQELLTLARADADAFVVFYDRHEGPLLAFLVRVTGDPEIAADVAAEVFATLIREIGRGTEIAEPRGWLYTVARRKVIDGARRGRVDEAVRRQLGMQRVVLTDEAIARIDELGDDRSPAAAAALAGLPDDQRAAVAARVVEELSYDEIAERLQCSPAVARKRVSRGLSRLRARLGEELS